VSERLKDVTNIEDTPFNETGTIQFGVEGLPFSAVRAPLDLDPVWVMERASLFLAAYQDAFPPSQTPVRQVAPRQSAPAAPRGTQNGTGLYCPDHEGVQLIESAAQYQTYDEGPDGEPIPAKFFCPGRENGTGKNHSVWRSKAVVG